MSFNTRRWKLSYQNIRYPEHISPHTAAASLRLLHCGYKKVQISKHAWWNLTNSHKWSSFERCCTFVMSWCEILTKCCNHTGNVGSNLFRVHIFVIFASPWFCLGILVDFAKFLLIPGKFFWIIQNYAAGKSSFENWEPFFTELCIKPKKIFVPKRDLSHNIIKIRQLTSLKQGGERTWSLFVGQHLVATTLLVETFAANFVNFWFFHESLSCEKCKIINSWKLILAKFSDLSLAKVYPTVKNLFCVQYCLLKVFY